MSAPSSADVILRTRTHPKVFFTAVVIEAVLSAGLVAGVLALPNSIAGVSVALALIGVWLLITLVVVVPPVVSWLFTTTTITHRSIRTSRGVVARRTRDIPVSRITDISIEQGVLDRIFGCGTVILADAANPEGARMVDVPNVEHVRATLDSLIHDER